MLYCSLVLNFIVPFVMVLTGAALRKHPVTDMSSQNGYNTPVSRKSQAHWDYAQKIAPKQFILLGKYLFAAEAVLNIALLLLRVSVNVALMAGSGIGIVVLIAGFIYTDSKIEAFVNGQRDR